jgi:serine phosphatase RsbU (regulator of sigma subunit)
MKLETAFRIFIFSLLSAPAIIKGQDSLSVNSGIIQKRFDDSLKAVSFLKAGENFALSGQKDSALANIQKSLDIASVSNFPLLEADNYQLRGSLFTEPSDWEEGLLNYLQASTIFNRSGYKERESGIYRILADRYFKIAIYKKSAYYSIRKFSLCPKDSNSLMAESAERAADSYFYLPDDSLALVWYNVALHYFDKETDTSGLLRCQNRLASLYLRNGRYDLSGLMYQKILAFYAGKNDYKNIAFLHNNIGFLQFMKKDIDSAIICFREAVKYSGKTENDNFFLTDVYSNLAICYQNKGRQTETLNSFETALRCAKASQRVDESARIEHILSVIYFNLGDNYHAEQYCIGCINSSKASSSYNILKDCYKTYSEVLKKGNDFENALMYYENYLGLVDSINRTTQISAQQEVDRQAAYEATEQRLKQEIAYQEIRGLEVKNLKAENLRKENDLKLLLKQNELDRSEKDRLSQSLALELEKNQLREKEQRVRSLEQQQEIQKLTIKQKDDEALVLQTSKESLEKDNLLKDTELKNEKFARKMAVWIGVLMVLVAITILFNLVSSRKKNRKLAESKKQIEKINSDLEIRNSEVLEQNEKILQQKDIIEQKNQAITDSILYASRIQTAVLPPVDFLTEWGIDNFILYKPKDIVSGDFYWGMRKKGKIIIAAADCTGHGVPGAFMSMLGHAFLDEIVNTTETENAASILNHLRDEIINTLKQKGLAGEARDGMDISLCIIDNKAGKLDYAGANNPLYLISDGKMTKIAADRMPIGIHFTSFTPFTNHTIDIKKGDQVYIFSDGYADQFGGPKGKKFMYKPFQDLLLRNHEKPMELQKEILDNTFIRWIADREQVDDVLVIGLLL